MREKSALRTHEDGLCRCGWCGHDPLYMAYHDTEWGVPEYDSQALFEKLMLDGFQAGLSWIIILRKREAFRNAFDQFNPVHMAAYDDKKLHSLLSNTGIVRNRAKIFASRTNAQAYLKIADFSAYLWDFVDGCPVQNMMSADKPLPSSSLLSEKISKDLQAKGFNFVGPTIIYAFLQACGLINDHFTECYRYKAL